MKKTLLTIAASLFILAPSAHAIEITSFSASVSKKGIFNANVQFSGTDSDCTILLRASSNSSNAAEGTVVTSFSVISPSLSWMTNLKKKTKGNAYMVAQLVCPEGVSESENTATLKTKKIKSKKRKRLSVTKWLQKLSHRLD